MTKFGKIPKIWKTGGKEGWKYFLPYQPPVHPGYSEGQGFTPPEIHRKRFDVIRAENLSQVDRGQEAGRKHFAVPDSLVDNACT